jgi:Ni/Fe-hydrogenase subunit HybB-like protein
MDGLAAALFLFLIGFSCGGGCVAAIRDWRSQKPKR